MTGIGRQLAWHLLASVLFTVAHVFLMVQMRKVIYALGGSSYDFGQWLPELWYEYRKDVLGYVSYFCMYYVFRLAYSRLKGEASLIAENEPAQGGNAEQKPPEPLLVKKLDKEFLVRVAVQGAVAVWQAAQPFTPVSRAF